MKPASSPIGAVVLIAFVLVFEPGVSSAPVPASFAHSEQTGFFLQEVSDLPRDAAYLGTANCENCHEPDGRHVDEFTWYNTQDGVPGTDRLHKNALNQMFDSQYERQSEAFARALDPDVSDWAAFVEQTTGPCVRCHATVVNGYADYGVTCESCHGPAQTYLEPHKEPGNRAASIAAGMWDIYGKPRVWGAVCMNCHVLDDQVLIDAGHPDGADFDLGVKFQTTSLHFLENRSTYSAADIAAIGDEYARVIRSSLPVDDPELNNPEGGAPESGDPQGGDPEGGDPEGGDPEESAPESGDPRIVERIIERTVLAGPGRVVPVDPELRVVDSLPPTPAAVVAAVQGRLATVLRVLLDNGATSPQRIVPSEDPVPYVGADAQLLRLQREIIALALEALSKPPRQQEQ